MASNLAQDMTLSAEVNPGSLTLDAEAITVTSEAVADVVPISGVDAAASEFPASPQPSRQDPF